MKGLIVVLLASVLFAGLATARVVDVSMSGFAFVPDTVTVNQGDTVRWTNHDAVSHTSTSGKPDSAPGALWDSPFLANGQSWSLPVTFSGSDIPYFCRVHSLTMRGRLSVSTGIVEQPGRPIPGPRLSLRSLNPDAVSFELPARQVVSLRIYDATGQQRAVLLDNARLDPGLRRMSFEHLRLRAGLYIVSLSAGAVERNARMVELD